LVERTAVIYGERSNGWGEVLDRCHGVAAGLQKRGITKGDVVSVLLPNIPQMFELHYAVPMSGGVLNTINVRLEPETVAYIVPMHPVYLSVVPMFHCNGWNHPWAMAIQAATCVFTRDPAPALIFKAIAEHGVTHFGGAPIVLQMLTDAEEKPSAPYDPPINVFTAGAPPPAAILEKTKAMGLRVMQVYGLTETYGHVTQCVWREEWEDLDAGAQADLQARQGVSFPMMEGTIVVDRETGVEVPHDGETQGEIVMRGNAVMSGYYKNPEATEEAFKSGWFWSGDAAVVHPQGYIQIKDRLKDVIISGGENISSSVANILRGSSVPKPLCCASCQRPRRARSRSSNCAKWWPKAKV